MSESGNKAVGGIGDLMRAASKGDIAQVQTLLANGIEVNARDMFENTALIFAAGGGHANVVQLLLERGADVSASNHVNVTALKVAMSKGHPDVIQLLKDAEAQRQQTEAETPAEDDRLAPQRDHSLASPRAGQDCSSSNPEKAAEPPSSYESELPRLVEEAEEHIPPNASSPKNDTALETQSRNPVQVSDAVERLIAAFETLRHHNSPPTSTVSVADIAHKIMLTLPEAAVLTGLSRNHLRQAIEKGTLRAKLVERGWRVKRADLDDYVENL